jgi:PAS domain S-box-containing protein
MINPEFIRVLLIDDDEDDVLLTKDLLEEIRSQRFEVSWVANAEVGLVEMCRNNHDVCLLDYRLGAKTGIELMRQAIEAGCQIPVILLTGLGEHEVDLAAMRAGAADYLVKGQLQADRLERSIRYAIERNRAAAQAAFEQARLAAFGADVGLALAMSAPIDVILDHCARSMMQYLGASLAQIWIFHPQRDQLEPVACAGLVDESSVSDPELANAPVFGQELADKDAVLIPDLAREPRTLNPNWVTQQGFVAFAAKALRLENRLIGMMSVYSRKPLPEGILQELGSVANGIALCIERKQTEQALNASENRYRNVVESIKEVIFQVDQFGNWLFLNPAWEATTGFTVKDSLGAFFLDYICHDDREHTRHIFLQLLDRNLDFCRYETRLLTKDGKTRWVEFYMQLNLNAEGQAIGASGSLYDITERKQAEQKVEQLAAFPRMNPNPVLEFAADGTLSYSNDAALELARALKKQRMHDLLPRRVGDIVRDCLLDCRKRLREEIKVEGRTLQWSFFPVPSNNVVHCYGVDITEMLSLEAQFRHAQKLESVGQLAAGVAHDFNNILTVIQGYSDFLLKRIGHDETLARPARHIADASRRAAALTRQLLAFSRKSVIQLRPQNLNTVIQHFSTMLPRLLTEEVQLKTDYAETLPEIEADTGMIEQVVMNLAVNARDAMPRGGTLTIATTLVEVTEEQARKCAGAKSGPAVCLRVTDTGTGMDDATLGRIFEPFFSTKEVGKGTGLGLATVYGIVNQHRGWLDVESKVGTGTTFRVFFPVVTAARAAAVEKAPNSDVIRGGRETILLVEDEAPVRELVREILKQYQYRVVEAASGVEALKVWDAEDGKVDLLLTDMVMPEGINGRELAAQLRQRKPGLKVVYTSGYSPEIVGKSFSQGDTAFLQKPYQPPQLAQRVRETLDARLAEAELVLAK